MPSRSSSEPRPARSSARRKSRSSRASQSPASRNVESARAEAVRVRARSPVRRRSARRRRVQPRGRGLAALRASRRRPDHWLPRPGSPRSASRPSPRRISRARPRPSRTKRLAPIERQNWSERERCSFASACLPAPAYALGCAEVGQGGERCSAHLGVFACCVWPSPIQDGQPSPIPGRPAAERAGRGAQLVRLGLLAPPRRTPAGPSSSIRDRLQFFEESGRATCIRHFRVDERSDRQRRYQRLRIPDFSSRGDRPVCVVECVLELVARELEDAQRRQGNVVHVVAFRARGCEERTRAPFGCVPSPTHKVMRRSDCRQRSGCRVRVPCVAPGPWPGA